MPVNPTRTADRGEKCRLIEIAAPSNDDSVKFSATQNCRAQAPAWSGLRIDYAFANGRLQVFEINANPTIIGRSSTAALDDPDSPRGATYRGVMEKIIAALAALDIGDGPPIPVKARATDWNLLDDHSGSILVP